MNSLTFSSVAVIGSIRTVEIMMPVVVDDGTLVSFGLELTFPHVDDRSVASPESADEKPAASLRASRKSHRK